MRTTIELKKEHRALLHAIAAQRGWRGYSRLVEEAIELYLQHQAGAQEARRALLERKGAWSSTDTDRMRATITKLREEWTEATASS